MKITDSVELKGVKITDEGYLDAAARISRTGIQEYLGKELGKPEKERVRIYRGEDAVFDKKTLDTFANIPLTIEHPSDYVTAANWKELAVGTTGNEVMRDGDYLKIGLRITDASAVEAVRDGKRELSVGYEAQIDWTPGITADGQEYDGRQVAILANHLAITDAARAGSLARIGDSWGAAPFHDHQKEDVMSMKSVVLGDSAVQVAADDFSKVEAFKAKLAKDSAEATEAANAAVAAKDAELAAKDAEIAELKGKLVSDSDLEARIEARTKLVADARKIVTDYDPKGKNDAQIKREVVAQSGRFDISDATSDAYVDAAFDLLGKTEVADNNGPDPVRSAILDAKPQSGDAAIWGKALDSLPGTKKEA